MEHQAKKILRIEMREMDREDEGPVAMGRGREVLICSNGSVIPFLELQDKFWEDEAVEGGLSGMIEGVSGEAMGEGL